jgi:hypothetical protein
MAKFGKDCYEDEPELPLTYSDKNKEFTLNTESSGCHLKQLIQEKRNQKHTHNALFNYAQEGCLPRDIFRLTMTATYPEELEEQIKTLEEKFPSYIKFEDGERNLYKENLSKNKRIYFDIKKTAIIMTRKTRNWAKNDQNQPFTTV